MNNKQQTAVEWIEDSIQLDMTIMEVLGLIRQAKEMEKEQKANTWNNAINAVEKDKWESFEQYYNETFGGEQ
jgi:phosphoglycerate dehydrogenase-like enzyme